MKLLIEQIEEAKYITEAKEDGTKNLFIEGIFLQSAIKNKNGRIYPEHVMDAEVGRYIKESVDNDTAVGELTHPSSPVVDLNKVSHKIVSLKKDGTNYVGKAQILETDKGKLAAALIKGGVKLGVSSRGLGTLKTNSRGINEVQNDFRLATAADLVLDPSAPDAWVSAVMESTDWIFDPTIGWTNVQPDQIIEETKTEVDAAVRSRALQEQSLQLFQSFMNKLAKSTK